MSFPRSGCMRRYVAKRDCRFRSPAVRLLSSKQLTLIFSLARAPGRQQHPQVTTRSSTSPMGTFLPGRMSGLRLPTPWECMSARRNRVHSPRRCRNAKPNGPRSSGNIVYARPQACATSSVSRLLLLTSPSVSVADTLRCRRCWSARLSCAKPDSTSAWTRKTVFGSGFGDFKSCDGCRRWEDRKYCLDGVSTKDGSHRSPPIMVNV